MLETYALVIVEVLKIVLLATRYTQLGNSKPSNFRVNCRILLEGNI